MLNAIELSDNDKKLNVLQAFCQALRFKKYQYECYVKKPVLHDNKLKVDKAWDTVLMLQFMIDINEKYLSFLMSLKKINNTLSDEALSFIFKNMKLDDEDVYAFIYDLTEAMNANKAREAIEPIISAYNRHIGFLMLAAVATVLTACLVATFLLPLSEPLVFVLVTIASAILGVAWAESEQQARKRDALRQSARETANPVDEVYRRTLKISADDDNAVTGNNKTIYTQERVALSSSLGVRFFNEPSFLHGKRSGFDKAA